jgi:ABC-type transport system involved in multi-copper enzyme maturation permease subunit
MFSSVITVTEDYLGSVDVSYASEVYGIIISLVTFVTCYIISNIVFIKRDVKN